MVHCFSKDVTRTGNRGAGNEKMENENKTEIGNAGLGFILGFVPLFHFFQVHTFQRTHHHLDEVKITSTILILMVHTSIYLFKKFFIFVG